MKNGHIQAGKNAPLSPTDLRVLEESAERLMADMRIVTDECVARIEQACTQAQMRIESLEPARVSSASMNAAQFSNTWKPIPIDGAVPALDSYESAAYLARESGMTTGEIELMRGLKTMEHRQ